MSFYVPYVEIDDEHHWQRYNVSLSKRALAEVRAALEVEATDQWSFRAAVIHVGDQNPINSIFAFFFRNANDIITLRKFEPH
jgi:hypothetical protein